MDVEKERKDNMAKLVKTAYTRAQNIAKEVMNVHEMSDEDIMTLINEIKDTKQNTEVDVEKYIKTLNRLFVILNTEKMKRGIQEAMDNQLSIFDYDVPAIEAKD